MTLVVMVGIDDEPDGGLAIDVEGILLVVLRAVVGELVASAELAAVSIADCATVCTVVVLDDTPMHEQALAYRRSPAHAEA